MPHAKRKQAGDDEKGISAVASKNCLKLEAVIVVISTYVIVHHLAVLGSGGTELLGEARIPPTLALIVSSGVGWRANLKGSACKSVSSYRHWLSPL